MFNTCTVIPIRRHMVRCRGFVWKITHKGWQELRTAFIFIFLFSLLHSLILLPDQIYTSFSKLPIAFSRFCLCPSQTEPHNPSDRTLFRNNQSSDTLLYAILPYIFYHIFAATPFGRHFPNHLSNPKPSLPQ